MYLSSINVQRETLLYEEQLRASTNYLAAIHSTITLELRAFRIPVIKYMKLKAIPFVKANSTGVDTDRRAQDLP